MDPLVFISYSSSDKLIADAICARLENQNIRCWIAPRDVNPGRDYSDQIAEALERSTATVVIFSSGSNRSRHVKSEIDRAFSLGRIIVPFRVENIELDKGLAYYLAKTHWLDAVTRPLEQHIDRLAATLRQIISAQEPALASPALAVPATRPPARRSMLLAVAGITGLIAAAVVGLMFLRPGERMSETAQALPGTSPQRPAASAAPGTASPTRAPASVPAEQDVFAGKWKIAHGETLQGARYGGTVDITKRGARYELAWQTDAGRLSGIALADGNELCVVWGSEPSGLVLYRIAADGTLHGRWLFSGADPNMVAGVENATGGAPGALEGHYTVKGSNPDGGNSYRGKLEIVKTGATYQLKWDLDGRPLTGIGIRQGDKLFVAWAATAPFGVVNYDFASDAAKGVWTMSGATQTGIENLARH